MAAGSHILRHHRVVSFDAMNTIIKLRQPVGVSYLNAAQQAMLNIIAASSELTEHFVKEFRRIDADMPCYGKHAGISSRTWWDQLVQAVLRNVVLSSQKNTILMDALIKETSEILFQQFAQTDAWVLEPTAKSLLAHLRRRGIKVAVLSNFDERLRSIFDRFDILRNVDAMLLSAETGLAKPDPKAFEQILRIFACEPSEVIHVGDDAEKDYATPRRLGMSALLYRSKTSPEVSASTLSLHVDPTNIISSLDDIKRYLL